MSMRMTSSSSMVAPCSQRDGKCSTSPCSKTSSRPANDEADAAALDERDLLVWMRVDGRDDVRREAQAADHEALAPDHLALDADAERARPESSPSRDAGNRRSLFIGPCPHPGQSPMR